MLGDIANLFKKDASYTIKEPNYSFKKKLTEKTFLKKLKSQTSILKKIRTGIALFSSITLFFRDYSFGGTIYSKMVAGSCLAYFTSALFTKKKKKENLKKGTDLNFYIDILMFIKIFDMQKFCQLGGRIPCLVSEFWCGAGFVLLFTRFDFNKDRMSVMLRSTLIFFFLLFVSSCPGVVSTLMLATLNAICSLLGGFMASFALNYISREFYAHVDSLKRSSSQLFINFTEIPEPILIVDPESMRIIFYNLSGESFFNSHLREK